MPVMPAPVEPTPVVATTPYTTQQGVTPPIEVPEVLSPVTTSRDMLIAKARAFKDSQSIQARHHQPEQLSMNVDPAEQQSLEEARRMAREVLSSPFANQNLEVPAFIRKRQGMENQER